jgi:hypothetical protein
MILKHSLPIAQRHLSPLLPIHNHHRTPIHRLEPTNFVEMLLYGIVRVANAFHSSLTVVVAAAEGSDVALSAALAGGLAGGFAEV